MKESRQSRAFILRLFLCGQSTTLRRSALAKLVLRGEVWTVQDEQRLNQVLGQQRG